MTRRYEGLLRTSLALSAVFTCGVCSSTGAADAWPLEGNGTETPRRWNLIDIVTAPVIRDLEISEDGDWALYVVRRADVSSNRLVSTLHLVNMNSGVNRQLAEGPWMEQLRAIPRARDWSLLADIGEGQQLYRVSPTGGVAPIVANPQMAMLGKIDGAIGSSSTDPPRPVGILAYGWAPDGRSIWYSRPQLESPENRAVVDIEAWRQSSQRQWVRPSTIELRVRFANGEDLLVDREAVKGLLPFSGTDQISWEDDSRALRYFTSSQGANGAIASNDVRWSVAGGHIRSNLFKPTDALARDVRGPLGGRLVVEGFGEARLLKERLADGAVRNYGPAPFAIGGPHAAGNWLSTDTERAIVGVRYVDDRPRSGLLFIDRGGGIRAIDANGSLSNCSFNAAVRLGVCVRQSLTNAPDLVRIDARTGDVARISSLAPDHEAITPLMAAPRTWINRDGYRSTGFVVFPRGYSTGQRYPAIVVTHGGDAGERFVDQGFQWDYPVQLFAERGYVVLCINDPVTTQSAELRAAYDEWSNPTGAIAASRVQDLVWLNGVRSFEDAVGAMAAEGVVDPDRVGIAGYSRGSQMVNVTMTQSTMFKAASSGEGGYLEPAGYFTVPSSPRSYQAVFGGSPYDAGAVENYRRLSPTFRASLASGPLLQQVAVPRPPTVQFYAALRAAGIPSQITAYPGEDEDAAETHLFHVPRNRLAAMQENMEWFDFWLLGRESTREGAMAQYARWRVLREAWRDDDAQPAL